MAAFREGRHLEFSLVIPGLIRNPVLKHLNNWCKNMNEQQLIYLVWGIGIALIVGSWFRIVNNKIGWAGFVAVAALSIYTWMR